MEQRYYSPSEFYRKMRDDMEFDRRDAVILMCAILITSVGLNMDSIPTVIGAMLISPLMTPIMGMGVSLALYSTPLFKKSLTLLAKEILVSLTISTLYFWLSPISYASDQIIARTNPTIWDIVIAIIGGIAGFIGAQQKQSNNIVPGVAIATALMPPLCTIGYSIAQGNLRYFLGSTYLFLINFVFIMLASFVGMYVTSFRRRMREYIDSNRAHRIWFLVAIAIFTLPSLVSAGRLVVTSHERFAINQMVEKEFSSVTILSQKYEESDRTLSLVTYGEKLSDQDLDKVREKMGTTYGIKNVHLEVQQVSPSDASLSPEVIAILEKSRSDDNSVEDQASQKGEKKTSQGTDSTETSESSKTSSSSSSQSSSSD